jgi:hypothetical protein
MKSKAVLTRLFLCIVITGVSLYAYIYKQNELTELRMAIPSLAKEVRSIQEENHRLKYDIDQFESPIHLLELMRMPEFGSLKFGYNQDVLILPMSQPIPGKDFADLEEGGTL